MYETIASIKQTCSSYPHVLQLLLLSYVFLIFFSPACPVDSLERGTHKTQCAWLIPLSFNVTCSTSSTKHRSRMTDVLLGMAAERKCLEKGGGSPKCNTEALSCFCRHLYLFLTSDQLCSLRCMHIKAITNVDMLQKQADAEKLSIHWCPASAAFRWNQTKAAFNNSPEALTKGNGALQNHFLSNVAPNTGYFTNPSLFEVQTRKNEGAFWGLLSIWQQFGGIVYFGPSVWSMIDDRGENHEPLALTQTCKLLSADCCILCDIYQVDYSMRAYLQPGSSWSIPPKDRGKKDDVFAGSTLQHESWDPWSGQRRLWNERARASCFTTPKQTPRRNPDASESLSLLRLIGDEM